MMTSRDKWADGAVSSLARAVMLTLIWVAVLGTTAVSAQDGDIEDLLIEAEMKFSEGAYIDAVRLYRKADKASGETALQPILGLAQSYNRAGAYKNAVEVAQRGLTLASAVEDQVRLLNQLGYGQFGLAGDDVDKLDAAATTFERILELTDGQELTTRYNLARARLRQGRDDQGIAHLEAYLELAPAGTYADEARTLIAEPRRGRENLAPDASMVTLDGSFLDLADWKGDVVLVDFWATWCAPCIAAMPALRRLSKRAEKNPFHLLSISVDSERSVVEAAVAEHRMTWPQVWDERSDLAHKSFSVKRFPTYILIDHEGKIVYRASGWGSSIERQLMGEIATAIRRAKKAKAGK